MSGEKFPSPSAPEITQEESREAEEQAAAAPQVVNPTDERAYANSEKIINSPLPDGSIFRGTPKKYQEELAAYYDRIR